MTHVHYKFSSKLSYDTVVFDGPHITLRDLKRQIMGREKLRAGDCDLQITNAQTKEEYTDDEGLIPKGSSVIIRRIPIIGVKSSSSSKTRNVERSDAHLHQALGAIKAIDDQSSSRALTFFSKMANLADADVSEEDKIKVMINQSTYDTMNYNKMFGSALPATYTCYRCGNSGHHIRNCPTTGDKNFEAPLKIKKSTGIPRSFMVEVDDPNIKGAMLTNCGRYAIPTIDAEAYAIGKKEKPPFIPQEQPEAQCEEDPVPDELLCLICHDLLSDAVVIPCCGNSYCDDCIRTALLDSEEHVCPTCGQSDVSPDTLIANKFLRQAVNTFKKERGHTKSLRGAPQSQNPTPTPSPVPTPPPPATQIQPQKPYQPYQPTYSQQDPLLPRPQAADTPLMSQVCGALPTATGPAPDSSPPSKSLQTVQRHQEISDKEAEEKTHEDPAAAAPSVLVSHKEPPAAPSKPIPVVDHSPAVERPPAVSVNLQQTGSGPAPGRSGASSCWDSSSSSSTGAWNESNTLQLPPYSSSSSYPATPPPLFPSPHFHTFLTTQQPLSTYPPGYPPTTPVWTLLTPPGAPIPSLCSSTSSKPALIPKEWYRHQKKKERSPHRGSTYERSSSRSNSKSSKSKSSRSYSRSSSRSRSRSRSRSQGRSRDLHGCSHSSHTYSYGYKRSRSPTPSSSSSPRMSYRSRSRSQSDHRKNSHHSRHHNKKSASSSSSSRRRGESTQAEAGGTAGGFASYLYAQHANPSRSLELDRERYLQWKSEYKEWCDKYFSSYVSHFHQLPPPLLSLPPPPPQWEDREGCRNPSHDNSDSCRRRRTDARSPPSQSSSDSRTPPSRSSSDSLSTPSQSSSDSRSSPSHSSNDGRSPPSHSASGGRSTPSEDGAPPRSHQERHNHLPVARIKGSKEGDLQERSKDEKQRKNLSPFKHEQKSMKKHEDAAASLDDYRKDKRRPNTGPSACKDDSRVQEKATASKALESVQPLVKADKPLDKDYDRKRREQSKLEVEKRWRRSKHSDSKQDLERRHREKPSKGADRVDTDRYRNPGSSKAVDSRSEKSRKRRGEDMERSSVKAQCSESLKTKTAEDPETRKSESPNPFDWKKPKTEKKKERKTWPLTERDIWEGGIKVKPQKKISINIKLDGKRKEDTTEKQDLEIITGKTKEEIEKTDNREEEKLNRGETEMKVNEKKESCRDQEAVSKEKIKADAGQVRQLWEKATFRDDKRETVAEEKEKDGELEDFNLWHCALRRVEEKEEESRRQWEEGDGMEAREATSTEWRSAKEEEGRVRNDRRGQEMKPKEELMEGVKWKMSDEEEDTRRSKSQRSRNESPHDRPNTTADDGSSPGDLEERNRAVKTVEEYSQPRAAREDPLELMQVTLSKWEHEEQTVQTDALAVFLPSATADKETEGQNEQRRQRSVEMERDGARQHERGRDREGLSSSHRSVAPSSGKDTSDHRDRERRMEMEGHRERGRDSERPRDREKESKRSKEKGRDGERLVQKRNPTSSSHSYSYLTSHDAERRDRQRGGDQAESSRGSEHCKPRNSSPARELTQNRSRDDSKVEKVKRNKEDKVIKESEGRRDGQELVAKRGAGSRWEEEAGRVDIKPELEEGERPSSRSDSISSSASSRDDTSKERKKKQKKHKKEKRQLEEEELMKHKKKSSKKSIEEESGGEVPDRITEEEHHVQLCPVTLS